MGNTVVWKPAASAMSERLLHHAAARGGRPAARRDQFRAGRSGADFRIAARSPDLGGIHFTGSTAVFQGMWKKVGENIGRYKNYPRMVGETGGKDFIVAHPSADVQELAVAIVRGGFEYQGQKCSAVEPRLRAAIALAESPGPRRRDDARDEDGRRARLPNFMGAVIDGRHSPKITGYIDDAPKNATIVRAAARRTTNGYFIEPTLVETATRLSADVRGDLRPRWSRRTSIEDDKWDETLRSLTRRRLTL